MQDAILSAIDPYLRIKSIAENEVNAFCPFHKEGQERNPSFRFNLDKAVFFCHGCHAAGTIIDFMKMMEINPLLIERQLKNIKEYLSHRAEKERTREKTLQQEQVVIPDSFLGIFNFCPMDLVQDGFDEQLLRRMDIGFDTKLMRITFPLRDLQGNLVGISGRTVNGDHPRYLIYKSNEYVTRAPDESWARRYSIRKQNYLWNMHNVYPDVYHGETDYVVVVEGFKAALWCMQNGYPNTVALLGSYMGRSQAMQLSRLDGPVILFLDHDQAGIEGTKKIGELWHKLIPGLRVAPYPDADEKLQPDDLGLSQLNSAIQHAIPWREWRRNYGF